MIRRYITDSILSHLTSGKSIGLFGARRTGKTMLMNFIYENTSSKVLMVNGEDLDVAEILSSKRISTLKQFIGNHDFLFIDEAQKIPGIGLNLKLIVDNIEGKGVFFTGSSSLDLYHQIGEPLTGRGVFYKLFPLAQMELNESYLDSKQNLAQKLVFGTYPQVFLSESNAGKIEELNSIKNGYLLKDILEFDNQKDTLFVLNLLRLIAFQIGNDISYSELANRLQVNVRTVQRYLSLLEKMFIVFSLPGFSRNMRNEYTKTPRYYFWDTGIRNCLISNFNDLNLRDDVGKLWENYCIAERIKKAEYTPVPANRFFWRTYSQQEIDLLEEREGKLYGYEFKWKEGKSKVPPQFAKSYPEGVFKEINPNNYLDFIG